MVKIIEQVTSSLYKVAVHDGKTILAIGMYRVIPQLVGVYLDFWLTPRWLSKGEITRYNRSLAETRNYFQDPKGIMDIQLELSTDQGRLRDYKVQDVIFNACKHLPFVLTTILSGTISYLVERHVNQMITTIFPTTTSPLATIITTMSPLLIQDSLKYFNITTRYMGLSFQMDHIRGLFFRHRNTFIGQGNERESVEQTTLALMELDHSFQWHNYIRIGLESLLSPTVKYSTLYLLRHWRQIEQDLTFDHALGIQRGILYRQVEYFSNILGLSGDDDITPSMMMMNCSQVTMILERIGLWVLWTVQTACVHGIRLDMTRRMVRWAVNHAQAVRGGLMNVRVLPGHGRAGLVQQEEQGNANDDEDDDESSDASTILGTAATAAATATAAVASPPPTSLFSITPQEAPLPLPLPQPQPQAPHTGLRLHQFIFGDAFGVIPLARQIRDMGRDAPPPRPRLPPAGREVTDTSDIIAESQLLKMRMFWDFVRMQGEAALSAHLEDRR